MAQWYSIEVFDGAMYAAAGWAEAFGDALITEALQHGATNWEWHPHTWGTVLEVELSGDEAWAAFLASMTAQRALDAVPDPVSGLIIYRGRGGSAGGREPRRPRPLSGSGAAALPLPMTAPLDADPFAGFAVFPERRRALLG